MSRIGFIGTGHIAAPMVRHLTAKGHTIFVTRRNAAISADLHATCGATVCDPQNVVEQAEIVFLCVRPQYAREVLEPLRFRPGQGIVSVMAGVPRTELLEHCAPAKQIVQMIPLGFLEKGGCPLAAFGDTGHLPDLFAPENPVVPVDTEAALNAHFAICAFVPGLLDLIDTAAGWLADTTGDTDRAEFFTSQLITGFLAAMETSRAGHLAEERDALATPNTLSLQMTEALHAGGAHDALRGALGAIGTRLGAP